MSRRSPRPGGQSPEQPEEDAITYQNRLRLRMTLRGAVVLYLCWLIFELVRGYLTGQAGMSLPMVAAAVAAFASAGVAIVLLSVRQWRRGQEKLARMCEEQPDPEDEP